MDLDIILGIIGLAFVVLVIFVVITLQRLGRAIHRTEHVLKEVQDVLRDLSGPCVELMDNANKLILSVKKKSEGLDVLFAPLYGLKKEKHEEHHGVEKIGDLLNYLNEGIHLFKGRSVGNKGLEKVCDLLGHVSTGIQIFSKIKDEIKK